MFEKYYKSYKYTRAIFSIMSGLIGFDSSLSLAQKKFQPEIPSDFPSLYETHFRDNIIPYVKWGVSAPLLNECKEAINISEKDPRIVSKIEEIFNVLKPQIERESGSSGVTFNYGTNVSDDSLSNMISDKREVVKGTSTTADNRTKVTVIEDNPSKVIIIKTERLLEEELMIGEKVKGGLDEDSEEDLLEQLKDIEEGPEAYEKMFIDRSGEYDYIRITKKTIPANLYARRGDTASRTFIASDFVRRECVGIKREAFKLAAQRICNNVLEKYPILNNAISGILDNLALSSEQTTQQCIELETEQEQMAKDAMGSLEPGIFTSKSEYSLATRIGRSKTKSYGAKKETPRKTTIRTPSVSLKENKTYFYNHSAEATVIILETNNKPKKLNLPSSFITEARKNGNIEITAATDYKIEDGKLIIDGAIASTRGSKTRKMFDGAYARSLESVIPSNIVGTSDQLISYQYTTRIDRRSIANQEKEQGRRVGIWGRYGKKELELSTRSKDVKAIIVSTYFNKGTKESETNYSSRFNKIASYTNQKHNYSYGIDLEQRII